MDRFGKISATSIRSLVLAPCLTVMAACNQTAPMVGNTPATSAKDQTATQHSAFSQFPDIPVPAGAKMNIDKTLVFGSAPWFGQLALTSSSDANTMFDFFRNNLNRHNWQEVTSVRAPTSILTYMREDRVLAISIQGSTLGGSTIAITVSPKGGKKMSGGSSSNNGLMPVTPTELQ